MSFSFQITAVAVLLRSPIHSILNAITNIYCALPRILWRNIVLDMAATENFALSPFSRFFQFLVNCFPHLEYENRIKNLDEYNSCLAGHPKFVFAIFTDYRHKEEVKSKAAERRKEASH